MRSFLLPSIAILFSVSLPGQSVHADCSDAYILCSKETFAVKALEGAGNFISEVRPMSCYNEPFPETNSVWLKWTVATSGTLGFILLPFDEQDDLDFVLYRLPNGLDGCESKEELRCMAAGKMLGEETPTDDICSGATGLRDDAHSISESLGCRKGVNNFLSTLDAKANDSYALFVNNFRSANGFLLEFSGTCTFNGSVEPCDIILPPVLHNFGDGLLTVSQPSPNPAKDEVQFTLQASISMNGSMLLADAQGHILQTQAVSVLPGDNFCKIQISSLNPGVYFVKMRFDDRVYLSRFYKG